MIQFFSQLIKLPVDVFVYSMEMVVHTMQGIQQIAYQGIDTTASWDVQVRGEVSDKESVVPEVTPVVPEGASREHEEVRQITTQKEERYMADKDLHDDMLKLIRYKILFVKRDYEHAFQEIEELVSDNTDAASYTAWKIAQFIQRIGDIKGLLDDTVEGIEVPKEWKGKGYPADYQVKKGPKTYLTGFSEHDKKYLRLFYEVLERYPREKFKYEEEQIDILRDISNTLKKDRAAQTMAAQVGAGQGGAQTPQVGAGQGGAQTPQVGAGQDDIE